VSLLAKIDGFSDFYAFCGDDARLTSVSVFRDAGDVFGRRHAETQQAA
jgi:hypothetical protein